MKQKKLLLSIGAAVALAGGVALAQQPGQPMPNGHPVPGAPGAQPGGRPMPGMPGRRFGQPGRPGLPPGHPSMPGAGVGRRRGLPPGFDPRNPHRRPRPRPVAVVEEEHAAHHECPGHGANDPPPHMNLWRGLFMVNNERAQQPDFVNQLLFRYENPKDPCDPKNEPPPFLASLINFGILAFVLYKYGRKPLADALQKRKNGIMAEIDTATKLKEDAEARLDEYQEQIDNIEAKLEDVRSEYAAQAEQEKKHILVEAEERRVRMRKDAELRIEQELEAARAELLREAVVNAVAAAEELVVKQIASKDLDRMANDYLSSVGASISGAR